MSQSTQTGLLNAIPSCDSFERSEFESFVCIGKKETTLPLDQVVRQEAEVFEWDVVTNTSLTKRRSQTRNNELEANIHSTRNALHKPHTILDCVQDSYVYDPLPSQRTIRLMEIDPSKKRNRALSCRFKFVNLDSVSAYEAISYRWGGEYDCVLQCNRKHLRIRRNLMDVLTRLRHPDRPRWIWADAVCIDQKNKDEKSYQIALMQEIYKKASRVIVWLGEDDEGEATEACKRIRSIASLRKDSSFEGSWWKLIAAFYRREWFSRLWVFQEIAMAASAEVLWGASSIPWGIVCRASVVIRNLPYQALAENPIPNLNNAHLFHRWSNIKKGNSQPKESFLYMLQVTRKLHCEKPKDRIYALLGFHALGTDPDNGNLFLKPNVKGSTLSLYRMVARKALRQMRTLDVLSAVQHESNIRRPTWVPWWNTGSVITLAPLGEGVETYAASLHLPAPLIRWTGRWGKFLRVSGIKFDSVIETTSTIPSSRQPSEQTAALVDILASLLTKASPYPTGETLDQVGCWTLTAGKDWYGMIVENKPKHLADFAAFWAHNGPDVGQYPSPSHHAQGGHRGEAHIFAIAAGNASGGRRLFYTSKGYVGIGPAAMQDNDTVCILSGGVTPFIIRQALPSRRSSRKFMLIGEAYIHGIMQGEATCEYANGQQKLIKLEMV